MAIAVVAGRSFPRARPAGIPTAAAESQAQTAAPQADRRSVLYIEHLPEMARLLRRILRHRTDLHLIVAASGVQGLELAAAEPPAVILLDLNLSDIAADEVLRGLKANPHVREIPVFLVGGVADEVRRDEFLARGASGYVVKPFTVAEIGRVVPEIAAGSPAGTSNNA